MASKRKEAEEHIRAAEKAMKTSFLKWKPDIDVAADEYNEAAQCYRQARDLEACKNYFVKASEMYVRNKSSFHAAKALENALIATKDISTPDELYNLALESAGLYQIHGSGDAAANVMDKTAKMIQEKNPRLAVNLYQQASDVSQTTSGEHQAAEYQSKASRLLVTLTSFDEAANSIRREITLAKELRNFPAIGRLTLCLVLVQIAREDVVAAEKVYKEWGGYCEAPEMNTIEMIIQAFDEEDGEMAKRALTAPFIRHMDVEYARLANMIKLPKDTDPQPKAQIVMNAAPCYIPQNQRDADPDVAAASSSGSGLASQDTEDDDLC